MRDDGHTRLGVPGDVLKYSVNPSKYSLDLFNSKWLLYAVNGVF